MICEKIIRRFSKITLKFNKKRKKKEFEKQSLSSISSSRFSLLPRFHFQFLTTSPKTFVVCGLRCSELASALGV